MTFTANAKRQKGTDILPSLFGCFYSRVKLFVFAMNSRRSYSTFVCFIYGLEEKNSKSKVSFVFLAKACNVKHLFSPKHMEDVLVFGGYMKEI